MPYQNLIITKNTHKMEALSKEQRQKFVIENHSRMTNKEIAQLLNVSFPTIRADKYWLVKKGIITENGNPVNENIIVDNDIDVNTIANNIHKQVELLRKKSNKNTYANHKGENKDIARKIWVKYIIESGLTGNLISLMNTEVSGEREILNALPDMKITGIECVPEVYKELRKTVKLANLPIITKLGYVHEFMYGVESDTYAHMILDYCGCLSTKTKELEYTINQNLVQVGGYIALTIKREIRQIKYSDNARKLLSLTDTKSNVGIYDNVPKFDRLNEIYIQKLLGFNYQLVEVFNYRDTTNMTLFMIKRIK